VLALLALATPPAIGLVAPRPAGAEPLDATLVLNPGGGAEADGSDGIQMRVMPGSMPIDAHAARGQGQWCCGSPQSPSGRLMLVVGTTAVGFGFGAWTSVELVATDGSATTTGGTDAGSATAELRYTAEVDGAAYVVDRTLTYVHPNDFLTDVLRVTIPDGSTAPVKLHYWGDAAPGGSDAGYGVMLTEPRRSIISLNTLSGVMFGFRELPGALPFAGARSETLGNAGPLMTTAAAGGSVGFNAEANVHDAMLWVEWDIGSTPGTYTAGMEVFSTPQGATLTAGFRDAATTTAEGTLLDLQIVNTNLEPADELAFSFELPAGLVAAGEVDSSCGGTVELGAGGTVVGLAGGLVAATSNCVISVPVAAAAPGTYTISSASVLSTSPGLDNGVGSVSLEVTGAPVEPEPDEPATGPGLPVPIRLLDTRTTGDPLVAGEEREVVVTGPGGVPEGATAVVLTTTVVDPEADGHLTVHPCGALPPTSSANFAAGQTVANAVTIGLDDGGRVCVTSTAAAELIVDVGAAYQPTGTAGLVPLPPSRLVDTREGLGVVEAAGVLEVPVTGRAGVPDDATSVVLDVVVTEPEGPGHATVFACGPALPPTSNLNYAAGQTVAAGVVTAIGEGGAVCVKTSATAHVVVDVQAAYGPSGEAALAPLTPARLIDSRPDRVEPGTPLALEVRGQGGVPADASAVVLNLTAADVQAAGYVTVSPAPCGDVPLVSNLNVVAGQTVANAVTAPVGDDGRICLTTSAPAALVVDVTGAFVP